MIKVCGLNVMLPLQKLSILDGVRLLPHRPIDPAGSKTANTRPASLTPISQCQILDEDVKLEPVDHYHLNLYNPNGRLIASAPSVDGLFILDRIVYQGPESTE
jgi:hypothetical protein